MEELIHLDQQLLLALNGSDSPWLDHVMLYLTRTTTWLPLAAVLLLFLLRNRPWRETVLFVVGLSVVVLIDDQFSSTLCKPFFHRFRPSHEPMLAGLVDLVDNRRGGLYGFISSHAANTFGVFSFATSYLRRSASRFTLVMFTVMTLFLWACLSSYSRIYLGLHYPADILAGALVGLLFGALVYKLTSLLMKHQPSSATAFGRPVPVDGYMPKEDLLLPIGLFGTLCSVCLLALL